MEKKELSYEGLKSVMKHMEANRRLEAVVRCPSIRNAEKQVRLKINELVFHSNYSVQINNRHYKLSVIRKPHQEKETPQPSSRGSRQLKCLGSHQSRTPGFYQKVRNSDENRKEESFHDCDQWGFERPIYGNVRTPGDIVIGRVRQETEEDRDWTYESEKRNVVERLNAMKRDPRSTNPMTGNPTKLEIERLEKKLLAFAYRDKNITPPTPMYDFFMQLTVGIRKKGSHEPPPPFQMVIATAWKYRRFERVVYTKKLHEAMKYFLNLMFGGRTEAVNVKYFEVTNGPQIIRLTEGVKFHIHQLKCGSILENFPKLSPYIAGSCLPIKHIFLPSPDELNSPMARSAEEVTVTSWGPGNMVDIIQNLSCPKFNHMRSNWRASNGNMVTVIENLLKSDKGIGTRYQFKFEYMNEIESIFGTIESRMNGKIARQNWNGAMTIPMSDEKELQLSYKTDTESLIKPENIPSLNFKIEIKPKSDLSIIDNSELLEAFRRSIL